MDKCDHIVLEILSLNTHTGMLHLQCEGCNGEVEVEAQTLPAMQGFLEGEEFRDQVEKEAKLAGTLAMQDYSQSKLMVSKR